MTTITATRDSTKDTQNQINNNTVYTTEKNIYKGGVDINSNKVNINADNFTDTGKVLLSSLSTPSTSYIRVSVGADGIKYIAPSNGFVCVKASFKSSQGSSATGYFLLKNVTNKLCARSDMSKAQTYIYWYAFLPVSKSDVVQVMYSNLTININDLYFIYSKGSESEASNV